MEHICRECQVTWACGSDDCEEPIDSLCFNCGPRFGEVETKKKR
jgi:hypothetical protein